MLPADIVAAVLTAIDSKLISIDPVTLEELELVQKLTDARSALEAMAATPR